MQTMPLVGQRQATDGQVDKTKGTPRIPQGGSARTESSKAAPMAEKSKEPEHFMKNLEKSIQELQGVSDIMNRRIQFNVNQELDRVVIKIVDPATNTVIKEIPSKDIQNLQQKMKETLGILVDEQT
jgi:flagellar protein FlaG